MAKRGRKSKYKSKYCEQIITFFDVEPYRKELVADIKGYGKTGSQNFEKQEYKLVANRLPMFSKFARSIGTTTSSLDRWCKKHEEFREAYNTAKEMQKEFLMDNGLAGLYPPASFIFTAKNITDMKDVVKQEQDVHFTGLENLDDETLDKLIAEKQARIGKGTVGEGEKDRGESP